MEFPLTANKAKWFPVYERVDVSEKPEPADPYRCMVTGALCGLKPLMFTFSDQSAPEKCFIGSSARCSGL